MWFYEVPGKGERAGPFSDDDVGSLVAGDKITNTTLVWREGMAQWKQAQQTELGKYFTLSPPPLPISNGWLYALTSFPIWGTVIQMIISMIVAKEDPYVFRQILGSYEWFIFFAGGSTVLAWFDEQQLQKAGYKDVKYFFWLSALLIPIYLYVRGNAVRKITPAAPHGLVLSGIWVVCHLLGVALEMNA